MKKKFPQPRAGEEKHRIAVIIIATTYNSLYLNTRRKFIERELSCPDLEARILTAFAAGKTPEELIRDRHFYASDDIDEKLCDLVSRRLTGEPVAYITGTWEFYGLPIKVSPDVLIPRADTELLADRVIKILSQTSPNPRVLDLCTGSGCIGLAIAKKIPGTRVVLGDINPKAIEICRENARVNKLEDRLGFWVLDAGEAPPKDLGSFDIIVCNPPYIPTGDIGKLDNSVRDYEPLSALDGGEDGLYFYRSILRLWRSALRAGGIMLFEVGIYQAEDVKKLMRINGATGIGAAKDTLDIDRVIWGKF